MVATAGRIAFVRQEYRTAVSSDATVKTNYGSLARDTGADVIETHFDSAADAATMAAERMSLLSGDRRRFKQTVRGARALTGTLDVTQRTPTATVIDEERQANHAAAIVEVVVDLASDTTSFVTWG